MTGHVLSRWAVAQEFDVFQGDLDIDGRPTGQAAIHWFEAARGTYVDKCRALSDEIESGRLRLSVGPMETLSTATLCGDSVLVAASVTELRPTSFDMAFRARACGDPGGVVANGVVTLALVDAASDQSVPVPGAIRADLIAMEKAAQEYC